MKRGFLIVLCMSMVFMLVSCVSPYEGKHLSRSFPHSMYNGLPLMETITMGSTNGSTVTFNYNMEPRGENKYFIEGSMDMTSRVEKYSDIDIYLLLIDKGTIVKAIRMNASSTGFAEKILFFKEFETDKKFNALTFNFHVKYYS